MSKVDWSKAPEGATHHVDGGWYKKRAGKWYYWSEVEQGWIDTEYTDPENFSWWGRRVERPAPQWNGEGLPPVGALVEWSNRLSPCGWTVGQVIAHDGNRAVIKQNADSYLGRHPSELRPIRTPEQLAAEAREKAVEEMWSVYWQPHAATAKEGLGLLYDAGYRKLEQPE